MSAELASAVYEGMVQHRRHLPCRHAFRYRMAMLYIDLDELPRLFEGRWLWSVERANLACFRRSDYLGPPTLPLKQAVHDAVEAATGERPAGPVRLLTHLRYGGHAFNPVSFYYCFDEDGSRLSHVVAEITNTPWRERHAVVLPLSTATAVGDGGEWFFDKRFHVSPFLPMALDYRWRLGPPGASLRVHMGLSRGGERQFDASLSLRRRPIDGRALAAVLCRQPLMGLQVLGAIHWQALRLWWKGVPVHDHPGRGHAPALRGVGVGIGAGSQLPHPLPDPTVSTP